MDKIERLKNRRSFGVVKWWDNFKTFSKNLTINTAYTIGRTFGHIVCTQFKEKTIVVGYDGRLSSPDLHQGLCKGLIECGIAVKSIGVCPTPMLYFAHYHLSTNAAIMVTGSHNPSQYNGFKLVLNKKSFFAENIQLLQTLVDENDLSQGQGTFEKINAFRAFNSGEMRDIFQIGHDGISSFVSARQGAGLE